MAETPHYQAIVHHSVARAAFALERANLNHFELTDNKWRFLPKANNVHIQTSFLVDFPHP
jgi:hypothetical protein